MVKTIKAFWCVFNNLSPVDQLHERESYHLMRDTDRRPVWSASQIFYRGKIFKIIFKCSFTLREDELNAHGGMWSFRVKKEHTVSALFL